MHNLVKKFVIPATLILTSVGASADNDDARAFYEAKITLQQAIEAAVNHHGGQPFEASIDDDSFSPAYEVSVVKRSRVFDIRLDAISGEVTGIREDLDD